MDRYNVIYDPTIQSYIIVDHNIEVSKIKEQDISKAYTIALNQKENLVNAMKELFKKYELGQLDSSEILKARKVLELMIK